MLGRSLGEGNDNPLLYSCLENPMDRRAWRAIVHEAARVRHDLATKPPTNHHQMHLRHERGEAEIFAFIVGGSNVLYQTEP